MHRLLLQKNQPGHGRRTFPRVESLEARQLLSVAAIDNANLYFSNAKATGNPASVPRLVTITNTGTGSINFSSAAIASDTSFAISSKPAANTVIAAGTSVQVGVTFTAPSTTSAITLHTATLTLTTTATSDPTLTVNLHALALTGYQGTFEPSLVEITNALYQIPINIGSPATTLALPYTLNGSQTVPLGDEVVTQRFVKAGSGSITVKPLATFGPAASAPFSGTDYTWGYYTPGQAAATTAVYSATTAAGSPTGSDGQTVNPIAHPTALATVSTDGNNIVTFDPGSSPFGLYTFFPVESPTLTAYSQDALNASQPIASGKDRRMRFWQAKNTDGTIIPHAYIGGVEEATNNDLQDAVFLITNVDVVSPRVSGVSVSGSSWTGAPYQIPAGTGQLANIPFTDLNQVSITFNENVTVTSGELSLTGASGAYAISSFSYNPTTFVATWTLPSTIAADHLHLTLSGVTDNSGIAAVALDGEWTDGVSSFPSGNGNPGGNFTFAMNVLPLPAGVTCSAGAVYTYASPNLGLSNGMFSFTNVGSAASLVLNVTADSANTTVVFTSTTFLNALTLTNGAKASVTQRGSYVSDGAGGIASYGNSLTQANTKILDLNSLSIPVVGGGNTAQGTLDLTNNSMILNYTGTSAAALAGANGLVKSGSNDGVWNGAGVTSSNAAADANNNGYTAVGVADNSDLQYAHFAGQDVSGNSHHQILFMYTWYGDGDLSGTVLNPDLLLFEAGRPNNPGGIQGSGWEYGLFDYNVSPAGSNADLLLFEQGQAGYKAFGAINGGGTYS